MKVFSTLNFYCLFFLLIVSPVFVLGQDGLLDAGFGNQGKVFIEFPRPSTGYNVIQQPDGKLIVVGSTFTSPYELYIARLNPNGSLDSTFGISGKVHYGDIGISSTGWGKRIALRSDGKIVIVVTGEMGSTRQIVTLLLNTDGSIDNSTNSGKVYSRPSNISAEGLAVAIQPDSKVLMGGISSNGSFNEAVIFRRLISGFTDPTFNNGEPFKIISFPTPLNNPWGTENSLRVIRLQKDGKIVLGISAPTPSGSRDYAVVRLNPNGSFDNSFNGTGIRLIDVANFQGPDALHDLVIQEDCKILVAGWSRVSGNLNFSWRG
jgi:uncharacterized delta-60 repeat protein